MLLYSPGACLTRFPRRTDPRARRCEKLRQSRLDDVSSNTYFGEVFRASMSVEAWFDDFILDGVPHASVGEGGNADPSPW